MTKEQARRKEYFEKMELLNENGKQKVFEYIDLMLTVDYTRADYKPQNAQIVNFEK